MATYLQVHAASRDGEFRARIEVAIARAQDAKQKEALFPANNGEKAWVNRDPASEAERIYYFVLNTAPVLGKLDAPVTITDVDIQSAVNTLVPALVKGA